jgi:ribonuclease-3
VGHRFASPSLLLQALTHSSTGAGTGGHNERLEFLGDAVLSLLVGEDLFRSHPEETEGQLTERKSALVSRPHLARVAARLGIERYLVVGKGIPRNRPLPRSILSNALEAILGAIYLDGGIESARRATLHWLRPGPEGGGRSQENHKKTLQHYAQARYGSPPTYRVLALRGPEAAHAFEVVAVVNGRTFPPSWGKTKREAEQWAAREAILVLEAEGETLP